MSRWRLRLLDEATGTVIVWEGEAEDGYDAERLASEAHPGAVVKSGSEVDE